MTHSADWANLMKIAAVVAFLLFPDASYIQG
jgi:hypothetical protein